MAVITQGNSPSSSSGGVGGFASNSFSQMGGGNTALALYFINQIMVLYTEIMKLQAEVSVEDTKVQNLTAKSTADAVGEADRDQANGLFFQGGSEISSGVASIATAIAPIKLTQANSTKMEELQNEIAPLKSLDKTAMNTKLTGNIDSGPDADGVDGAPKTDAQIRAEELERKEYDSPNSAHDKEALESLKNTNIEKFNEITKDISARVKAKETEINTIQSKITNTYQTAQAIGGVFSQGFQAMGNFGQGGYTQAKATEDTIAEISRTTNNQAGSTASSTAQEASKDYDKALQEIQTIQKINDSQRVGY